MISVGLLYVILGFHHHKAQKPAPPLPDIFSQMDSGNLILADMAELDRARTDYPWLDSLIEPTLILAEKLLPENGQEIGYQEDRTQLSVDLWLLESLEQNDTI